MTSAILTLCTCPDWESADKIARHLIEKRMAACVNILPKVTSVFRWQGQIEKTEEHLLIIKASASAYEQLEAEIHLLHPYDIPEIIAIPVAKGLPDYLNWIDSCHTPN